MYDEETLSEIRENLAKLLSNTTNLTNSYFDMFFNPTPMDVTLTQYDTNNQLVTYSIPNRAKDKRICITGASSPELNVTAVTGTFYIDTETNSLYYKSYGDSNIGWKLLLTEQDLVNHNGSLTAHEGVLVNYAYIGDKDSLTTTDKTSIVNAINSCKSEIDKNKFSLFTVNSGYTDENGDADILFRGDGTRILVSRSLPTYASKAEAEAGVGGISLDKSDYYSVVGKGSIFASIPNSSNVFTFTLTTARTIASFDFSTNYFDGLSEYTYITQIRGYKTSVDLWTVLYTSSDYAENITSVEGDKRNYTNVQVSNAVAYDKYEVTMAPSTNEHVTSIGVSKLNFKFIDSELSSSSYIYFKISGENETYTPMSYTNAYYERAEIDGQEPIQDNLASGKWYIYATTSKNIYVSKHGVHRGGSKEKAYVNEGATINNDTATTTSISNYLYAKKHFYIETGKDWEVSTSIITDSDVSTYQTIYYIDNANTDFNYFSAFICDGKFGLNIPDNLSKYVFRNFLFDGYTVLANTQYHLKLSYLANTNTLSYKISTNGQSYTELGAFKCKAVATDGTTRQVVALAGTDDEISSLSPTYATKYLSLPSTVTIGASKLSIEKNTPVFETQESASEGINGMTLTPAEYFGCTGDEDGEILIDTDLIFDLGATNSLFAGSPFNTVTWTTENIAGEQLPCEITNISFADTLGGTWTDVEFAVEKVPTSEGYSGTATIAQGSTDAYGRYIKIHVDDQGGTSQYPSTNIQNLAVNFVNLYTPTTVIPSGNYFKGQLLFTDTYFSRDGVKEFSFNGINGEIWLNTAKEPLECYQFNGTNWVEFLDTPIGEFTHGGAVMTYPYNMRATGSNECLPSNRNIALTISGTGTSYLAPADGYIYVNGVTTTTSNAYITITANGITAMCSGDYTTGTTLHTYLPVRKGNTYTVSYNNVGTLAGKFVYAQGSV